ncbi:hypothetical protein LWI28_013648 [Acer negundo]|uniref:Reverse transcriptase zinc-binding domain-containing protein n=1 Tax=Acer negundo TaxID=4023 RepID=A0AAD5IVZ5_ACENE|nr:hypothetical protein LWI28_013648 [Acer negundo]
MHWCTWSKLCIDKEVGGLGFCNLDIFNRALLGKQGWRILKNPNSLAARTLKACYFRDSSFMEATAPASSSFVWKNRWLPRSSGFRIISQPVLDINATVDNILTPSGGWDTNRIKLLFDKEDADEILSIPVGFGDYNDTLIWQYEISSNYSVSSGYRASQNLANIPSSLNSSGSTGWWKSLWKVCIPLKVKIFIWKAWHNWIPTKANLAKRGIKVDGICPQCNIEEESTLHALWNRCKLCHSRRDWEEMHPGTQEPLRIPCHRAPLLPRLSIGSLLL